MKISSKKLATTDIDKRLSMKTGSLMFFPPFAEGQNSQLLTVKDEEGNDWRFRLITRRGLYRKPVLSAGWRRFVRSKQLESGFKVQFFREDDEVSGEFKYRIKLKKPVLLFNSVLGYAPYRSG